MVDTERFDRNIRLFGREGQERIEATRVGVVGLGGLGSHIAQQLAYLGTSSFRLIDEDHVSQSSLNRLVGATPEDVAEGRRKVDVAERVIKAVQPDTDIEKVPKSFISKEGFRRLCECHTIFGCVDNDPARLVLNEFCQTYEISYLDIATDIGIDDEGGVWFGGRILYSLGGEMCVVCKGLLDEDAVRYGFSTDVQRQEEEQIYGVPRSLLDEHGPAVISLNGILASVAVTEFMVQLTGLRRTRGLLEYKGEMGILTVDIDPPAPDCYYCKGIRGKGDAAGLERYLSSLTS